MYVNLGDNSNLDSQVRAPWPPPPALTPESHITAAAPPQGFAPFGSISAAGMAVFEKIYSGGGRQRACWGRVEGGVGGEGGGGAGGGPRHTASRAAVAAAAGYGQTPDQGLIYSQVRGRPCSAYSRRHPPPPILTSPIPIPRAGQPVPECELPEADLHDDGDGRRRPVGAAVAGSLARRWAVRGELGSMRASPNGVTQTVA